MVSARSGIPWESVRLLRLPREAIVREPEARELEARELEAVRVPSRGLLVLEAQVRLLQVLPQQLQAAALALLPRFRFRRALPVSLPKARETA